MSLLRDALGIPLTQVPISLTIFVSRIIPLVVSYVAMAMLAVTPKTRVLRVALWPVVTLLTFRAAFVDLSQGKSDQTFFNGEFIRFIMCIPVYALSWTLAQKPLVRNLRPVNSSPSIVMDALDLVTNLRGVGWDWSPGLYIPPETRPTNRIPFALHTLLSMIPEFMVCTVIKQMVHTFTGGTGSNPQLTIFDETLPFSLRYLRSSIITILVGIVAYAGVHMTYHLVTLFGILLFGQDPAQWPPAFESPWYATSLTEFWGRRWHQWFRHTFLVCAYPFCIIFGRSGQIIGAFLASGLAHHFILLPFDRHSEMWRMLVGFGMMAPGMMAERAFYRATGRKVDGIVGWIWMVSWLVMWYNLVVEGLVKVGMYSLPSDSQAWGWVESLAKGFDAWLHAI